ncbi:hypothetical protein SD80_012000 [Scytonema tolypothrichoides VB-61278]|nr:hypothetical protein SD80_012000 [Scytonema tolypothrichoides VB-61278]
MRFLTLTLWLSLGLLLVPGSALAQGFPPDLIVRIRDAGDAGIGGVTVIVRDQGSSREVGRATTDEEGRAEFVGIEEPAVRVLIQGQAAGITLYQPGEDAEGIRLSFDTRPAQLDLRVEADGMVLPDPETMIDPDPSLADEEVERIDVAATIQALPEAPAAPIVVEPAATVRPAAAPIAGPTLPGPAVETEPLPAQSPAWLGWLLVVLFVGMCGVGAFAYQRWGRS